MSRRSPANEGSGGTAATPTDKRTTGTREFKRQAQASRRRALSRQERQATGTGGSLPNFSLDPRQALRRLPRAALICALVAFLNAACWSIVTPPFQATDEPTQFAYTQYLAEHGQLPPTSHEGGYSPEEQVVLAGLEQPAILWHTENHTISTAAEQERLDNALNEHPSRVGEGSGGSAADPPLYYTLELIPYALGSGGTLLDQLELMRLLSAVFAGLTALFAFLFARESLPKVPWAWTVGGLGVALAPLLGFASSSVNPDSLLFAISAAIFYSLARGFRRGLTRRLAIAVGLLMAAGLLTKPNFIGLIPGIVLALVVFTVRTARVDRRQALLNLGIALAIGASPAGLYVLFNLASGHPALGTASENLAVGGGSLSDDLSYVWQLYLPRLPGMHNYFPGIDTTRDMWFNRAIGLYGWLDTTFPAWVYTFALIPAGLIALSALRALAVERETLRRRLLEPLVYVVIVVGLMGLIGSHSYLNLGGEGGGGHAQPRYLMPLVPLLALVLALAARGAGRRWGPTVGVVIVVLFLGYDVFSQLLVVSRFYA